MRQLAPRDTGDLVTSLRVETKLRAGRTIVRIVSDDPQINAIINGTRPGYFPPTTPTSAIGRWGSRHGFTTAKSLYFLSRKIAVHGTPPAGTREGKQNWIKDAVREASR